MEVARTFAGFKDTPISKLLLKSFVEVVSLGSEVLLEVGAHRCPLSPAPWPWTDPRANRGVVVVVLVVETRTMLY